MLYPFELRALADDRLYFTRSWRDPKPCIVRDAHRTPELFRAQRLHGLDRSGAAGRDQSRHRGA